MVYKNEKPKVKTLVMSSFRNRIILEIASVFPRGREGSHGSSYVASCVLGRCV